MFALIEKNDNRNCEQENYTANDKRLSEQPPCLRDHVFLMANWALVGFARHRPIVFEFGSTFWATVSKHDKSPKKRMLPKSAIDLKTSLG